MHIRKSGKMHSTAVMNVTLWWIMCSCTVWMERCSLQQSTFQVAGQTGRCVHIFWFDSQEDRPLQNMCWSRFPSRWWCMEHFGWPEEWTQCSAFASVSAWLHSEGEQCFHVTKTIEWVGNASIARFFSRCKKCLPGNCKMRRRVLESIVLIHNFRTDLVGSNQISTVFDPEWKIHQSWGLWLHQPILFATRRLWFR